MFCSYSGNSWALRKGHHQSIVIRLTVLAAKTRVAGTGGRCVLRLAAVGWPHPKNSCARTRVRARFGRPVTLTATSHAVVGTARRRVVARSLPSGPAIPTSGRTPLGARHPRSTRFPYGLLRYGDARTHARAIAPRGPDGPTLTPAAERGPARAVQLVLPPPPPFFFFLISFALNLLRTLYVYCAVRLRVLLHCGEQRQHLPPLRVIQPPCCCRRRCLYGMRWTWPTSPLPPPFSTAADDRSWRTPAGLPFFRRSILFHSLFPRVGTPASARSTLVLSAGRYGLDIFVTTYYYDIIPTVPNK